MWTPDGRNDGMIFEVGTGVLIILNIVAMDIYHWTPPDDPILYRDMDEIDDFQRSIVQNRVSERANQAFTLLFLVEMLWKIVAFGFVQYARDWWNRLDAVVVVLTTVHLALESVPGGSAIPINPSIFRVLRIARLARAVKLMHLVKLSPATQHMIETLMVAMTYALPAIGNVMALMFLVIFVFAILGMNLFGTMSTDQEDYDYGDAEGG